MILALSADQSESSFTDKNQLSRSANLQPNIFPGVLTPEFLALFEYFQITSYKS
jgi:hypothetical protein